VKIEGHPLRREPGGARCPVDTLRGIGAITHNNPQFRYLASLERDHLPGLVITVRGGMIPSFDIFGSTGVRRSGSPRGPPGGTSNFHVHNLMELPPVKTPMFKGPGGTLVFILVLLFFGALFVLVDWSYFQAKQFTAPFETPDGESIDHPSTN